MGELKKKYNLFTAIAMIVGIVVGSGIFFKTDDILAYTQGNVLLGVIIFSLAALSIIFGSLSISELSVRTDKPGGLITYAAEFSGVRLAGAFGWFQTFIYYPTLSVVVSWVVGVYVGILFGLELTLLQQVLIGFAWFLLCFAYNIISPKFGGKFQEYSTVIKLIPLIAMAIAGLIWGDPVSAFANPSPAAAEAIKSTGWLAAIGPIAYSFDGWVISTSIANEIKDSKRNLPKALVLSPIFVLAAYLMYFIGISAYVQPEMVMQLGDNSVNFMAASLMGPWAAKLVVLLVVISVMGTVNGIVLGFIRLPYSLALRNMIPFSKKLSVVQDRFNIPLNSGLFAMSIAMVWWFIHFFTMQYGILGKSDISEIAIVMSYMLYVTLYYQVFKLYRKGEVKGIFRGVVFPLLATCGSAFILFAGIQNPLFLVFVAICLIGMAAGFFYAARNVKK